MIEEKQAFKAGFGAALPTALGYLGIGMALGIIAAAEGLAAWQVFLMSLLIYAGAAQFALVGLLVSQESVASIVLTIFLINLRNFLMALHTATLFPSLSWQESTGIGGLLTDESYGLLLGEHMAKGTVKPAWMLGNNFFSYLTWVGATSLGALVGERVPDPYVLGLDFALLAMFWGIFAGQFRGLSSRHPLSKLVKILVVVGFSFVGLAYLVPKSVAVLVATLCGCGMGVYLDED